MTARTSLFSSAASTFANPAATSPAFAAIANASSAERSSRRSTRSARSAAARTSRLKPRANTLRLTACSIDPRVPVIQSPRPGSFRLTSGTTAPSGPITNRISSETGLTSRVSAQVRSVPGATDAAPRSSSISCATARISASRLRRSLLGFFRRRRIELGLGDSARLHARLHDHRLGVLAGEIEALQIAGHMLGLAVLAFGPSDKIVRRAAGQILDRLHVVFAERGQHLGGDARNLLQRVLDPELLAAHIELSFLLLEIFARALLQLLRSFEIKSLDAGDFLLVDEREFFDRAEPF